MINVIPSASIGSSVVASSPWSTVETKQGTEKRVNAWMPLQASMNYRYNKFKVFAHQG
jgi:hypothetical protein